MKRIKVYATYSTAIFWSTEEPQEIVPGCSSYYTKEVNKSEVKNGVYIDNNELRKFKKKL